MGRPDDWGVPIASRCGAPCGGGPRCRSQGHGNAGGPPRAPWSATGTTVSGALADRHLAVLEVVRLAVRVVVVVLVRCHVPPVSAARAVRHRRRPQSWSTRTRPVGARCSSSSQDVPPPASARCPPRSRRSPACRGWGRTPSSAGWLAVPDATGLDDTRRLGAAAVRALRALAAENRAAVLDSVWVDPDRVARLRAPPARSSRCSARASCRSSTAGTDTEPSSGSGARTTSTSSAPSPSSGTTGRCARSPAVWPVVTVDTTVDVHLTALAEAVRRAGGAVGAGVTPPRAPLRRPPRRSRRGRARRRRGRPGRCRRCGDRRRRRTA
jgi:hypothetical protein